MTDIVNSWPWECTSDNNFNSNAHLIASAEPAESAPGCKLFKKFELKCMYNYHLVLQLQGIAYFVKICNQM